MNDWFPLYEERMVKGRSADPGAPLMGFLDAELSWNRQDPLIGLLAPLFKALPINSLLFCRPREPFMGIMDHLCEGVESIVPEDCETRTFLHELPIARSFSTESLVLLLKRRKSVLIRGQGILTTGAIGPEQAYVTFSSVCFALMVKFFADYMKGSRKGRSSPAFHRAFERAVSELPTLPAFHGTLGAGPFESEKTVVPALVEAGKLTVENNLVDSSFGNISYLANDILYISQTGAFLDDLTSFIAPCPLDGSSCAGLIASSELGAHLSIVEKTGCRAILHGHPMFSVILSLDCTVEDCRSVGLCHKQCPHSRFVDDIPIVSGEVGSGRFGLCHTVPAAMAGKRGVIVYGHGVFTTGEKDFNEPFADLTDIENMCRIRYFERLGRGNGNVSGIFEKTLKSEKKRRKKP